VSNRSVTVSWSATTLPGGAAVAGYVVRRYSSTGTVQTIGAGCAGTVTAASCTETDLPAGSWRYSVEPKQGNWTGPESGQSTAVSVAAPGLTLAPASVTSLPATLSGSLASFKPGQTVTVRLDDASSGTVLTSTVAPATIPSSGSATVSATLPVGVSNGSHTIYAVGSAGDVASAPVAVSSTTTITTSAWSLRDVSTTTLVDESAPSAFSGDGRVTTTGNWAPTFAATRYVDFDLSTALPAGKAVSGATFDYRRAASATSDTNCFYFEVRRISTGAVLAAHGSAASPVGCVTGTAQTGSSIALPELTTTDLVDDARIRVYASSSGSRGTNVDVATLSGTAGSTPFTLYATQHADAAAGGAATAFPWSQAALDGTPLDAGGNWSNTFQTSRYLQVTFPAYVPSGATVSSATLRHAYRPAAAGNTACWYAEAYSGGSLIATYGSSATPVGCNSSATTYTTDSLPLPEVNTAARANDLTIRLYFRGSANGNGRRTQHDLTDLTIAYAD
jgi:hypothetical protein